MNLRVLGLGGAAALLAAVLAAPPQGQAQPLAGGEPMAAPYGELRVNLSAQGDSGQSISIPRGKSAIVDLPVDARDVLVTDPKVADTVLRSPRKIYVMGLAPGQTDAVFFDAAGRRILALNIRVDQDFGPVAETISRIIPGARVHVEAVNNSVVLSGTVANQADADRAVQIAQQFTAKPEQVLNMLAIAGKDQVMLKVRIVEVQRSVIKQLGFNLSATLGQLGSPQYLLSSAATYAVNGSLLGGISGGYNMDTTQQPEVKVYDKLTGAYDLDAVCRTNACSNGGASSIATTQTTSGSQGLNRGSGTLQAFEQVGLVRTLAEPTLTTVSGEAAKFLAGGEFPVPTGEDSTGKVSIEFKPYGVGLGFTPVVLSSGRISLKISTEVSELTNQGSFNLATSSSSSLTIPGLNVRRAETVVELPSGGGMMIAGLLKEETKQDIDSLPGLMNLPVLGALFRSRDYQEGETELVVIVTPYLVQPTNPNNLQTPADGLKIANDAETILLGHINAAYHAPPQAAAAAQSNYQGPVGYVIE
jgi:pilus assembly protein CpaC